MAVNPKEKAALEKMWSESKAQSNDLPDGDYEFLITEAAFHMTDKGRPQMRSKVKVEGGAEDLIGTEVQITDNLETPENMGWFKKKLARLGIALPESFEEILDGTVADAMKGKLFAGTVKYKNDFMNLYVNRLKGEREVEAAEPEAETEEAAAEEASTEIQAGSQVTFTSKTDGELEGEILEVLEEEGVQKARCQAGKKVYKLPLDRFTLKVEEAAEEATEEAAEETEEAEEKPATKTKTNGHKPLQSPDEVAEMSAPALKTYLKGIGIDAAKVKNPRAVAQGLAGFVYDKAFKPELAQLAPLAAVLAYTVKKGEKPVDTIAGLRKSVLSKFCAA